MKKLITFPAVVLAVFLCLTGAMANIVIPETAADVPVPAHTVFAVSNLHIAENTISMTVSGMIDRGRVFCTFQTSDSTYGNEIVELFQSGSTLTGDLSALSAMAGSITIMGIQLEEPNADYSIQYQYTSEGVFSDATIRSRANSSYFRLGSSGELDIYATADFDAVYGDDGRLKQYMLPTANGYETYNVQHQIITSISIDPVTGIVTHLRYDNGQIQITAIQDPATNTLVMYDSGNVLRKRVYEPADGLPSAYSYDQYGSLIFRYQVNPDKSYSTYDANGTLTAIQGSDPSLHMTYVEVYRKGQPVRRTEIDESDLTSISFKVYEDGVLVLAWVEDGGDEIQLYDGQGIYIGKKVISGDTYKTYDAAGRLKEYTVIDGNVLFTYDGHNNLVKLNYDTKYFEEYEYDAQTGIWYTDDCVYQGPAPIDLNALRLKTPIVWYPNNTLCSFGPQFRDIDPALTDLWYMFTPIDISLNGTQTFELIAGNMYVIGSVAVTVSGDNVTVSYDTVQGRYGHVYIKSEYLNFFPDLKSVKTVVPEEAGPGYAFGQKISIQNDLNGDTNVLMFIRNVATFRNPVRGETVTLRRYYKNYPSRITLRDAMLEMMD